MFSESKKRIALDSVSLTLSFSRREKQTILYFFHKSNWKDDQKKEID